MVSHDVKQYDMFWLMPAVSIMVDGIIRQILIGSCWISYIYVTQSEAQSVLLIPLNLTNITDRDSI